MEVQIAVGLDIWRHAGGEGGGGGVQSRADNRSLLSGRKERKQEREIT